MSKVLQKIEDKILELREQNKDIEDYVYVITFAEYKELCDLYGVEQPKGTISWLMGVKISVDTNS